MRIQDTEVLSSPRLPPVVTWVCSVMKMLQIGEHFLCTRYAVIGTRHCISYDSIIQVMKLCQGFHLFNQVQGKVDNILLQDHRDNVLCKDNETLMTVCIAPAVKPPTFSSSGKDIISNWKWFSYEDNFEYALHHSQNLLLYK